MEFNTNEILEDYYKYNENVIKELKIITTDLKNDDTSAIAEKFSFFAEGLQWLEAVALYLKNQGMQVSYSLNDLESYLTSLVSAMEKQDYIMLSDIIEYELIPYFENLKVEN